MNDFKLKMILTILGGIVFSFIFIIIAFIVPTKQYVTYEKQPTTHLGKVSKSFKER